MYLFNPKYLEPRDGLDLIRRLQYLSGGVEDRFDSFHFLHISSWGMLEGLRNNVATSRSESGFFLQSRGASQSSLAAKIIGKYDKASFDILTHCHVTHPEDLNKCQISWLQHRMAVKVKYAFAIEYGGGINIPLALDEITNLIEDSDDMKNGILVTSERLLSPIGRLRHPMGWLSDGAAAVEFSLNLPECVARIYRIEELIVDYDVDSMKWAGSDRDELINKATSLLAEHLRRYSSGDEEIVYPAYDGDVIKLFQSVRNGSSWKMGRVGMSFGGEHLAWLACDRKMVGKVRLVFMEPCRHIASILLSRICCESSEI